MHPHDKAPTPSSKRPDQAPRAHRTPGGSAPMGLLALQASAGNAAVVQMLRAAGHHWAQPEQHQHGAGCGHQQSAEQPPVQRSAVHDVLRTDGRPLDSTTRADMESRLGADFGDVRIHNDSAARASAAEVGARAYTSGNHVVIGEGGADKHTLAHELTHVIQQRQGPVAGTDNGSGLKVSDPTDHFEREAEANATRVMNAPPGHSDVGGEPRDAPASARAVTEEPHVQRVTKLYSRAESQQDRSQDPQFRGEEITNVSHTRESISPRIKNIMETYGDGSGQGVYNHHVPHSAIVNRIVAGLNFKSRDQIVGTLNQASATLSQIEAVPANEFGQNPWASRVSFDTWVDEKICNIADWPANLFRWQNTGDRGGTAIDEPINPTPALSSRLDAARTGLRNAGLL